MCWEASNSGSRFEFLLRLDRSPECTVCVVRVKLVAIGDFNVYRVLNSCSCFESLVVVQRQIIHTKGVLWRCLRASMTLTGYLPPISENGSLLVDGAYLNAVPADIMRNEMNASVVISVDVTPESEREYMEYGPHRSGWWLLWNSLNPFVETVKVPSMGDISEMLSWVSSEQHRKNVRQASDLHLVPPVQDVGTLEYDRFDEIIEKSYNYAKPIVDEWVARNAKDPSKPFPRPDYEAKSKS